MREATIPPDDAKRVSKLRSLHILDTQPEERFDQITRLAKRLFGVSTVHVSLIDAERQWIKSAAGPGYGTDTPRAITFCGHAIQSEDVMRVEDTLNDERFVGNPLVIGEPNVRFYAGCPLRVGGWALGTLCLMDQHPRKFTADDEALLRDLASVAEQNLEAGQIAMTDPLTGLTNRRGFEVMAQQVLESCMRVGLPATLLFLDLNQFKPINDQYGHAEGDRALKLFAASMMRVLRESDAVARLGGDEFGVLLANAPVDRAPAVIERLRSDVNENVRSEQLPYALSFSVGAASLEPEVRTTLDALLKSADAAMYRDKEHSRSAR